MKPYIIVIFALLSSLWVYAQELSGVIKYRFIYSQPVHIPDNVTVVGSQSTEFEVPAYLYFNSQKSLFNYDKLAYKNEEASTTYKRKRDEYGQMYFIDKTKNELYIREFVYAKPYITHESVPIISWQLKNEVKTISGYVCKKAETTFRGRKYTVWYTSAIPVSVGPWKLQGLPGAILQAESEDKEVKFTTESIRIPAYVENELNIKEIPDGKIVTYKEYLESFEKERKSQEETMKTMVLSFFEEQKQQGKATGAPKREEMKLSIGKMFTIEKYE
jgi:GLPGLI family protein